MPLQEPTQKEEGTLVMGSTTNWPNLSLALAWTAASSTAAGCEGPWPWEKEGVKWVHEILGIRSDNDGDRFRAILILNLNENY